MPLLSTALVSLLLLSGQAGQAPPPSEPSLKGTVGVCVRWGDDPDHVVEAVVVVSSGNPILDNATPPSVRGMEWPRPTGKTYDGGWVGVNLSFDEDAPANRPLPSCAGLPPPKPTAPAA